MTDNNTFHLKSKIREQEKITNDLIDNLADVYRSLSSSYRHESELRQRLRGIEARQEAEKNKPMYKKLTDKLNSFVKI